MLATKLGALFGLTPFTSDLLPGVAVPPTLPRFVDEEGSVEDCRGAGFTLWCPLDTAVVAGEDGAAVDGEFFAADAAAGAFPYLPLALRSLVRLVVVVAGPLVAVEDGGGSAEGDSRLLPCEATPELWSECVFASPETGSCLALEWHSRQRTSPSLFFSHMRLLVTLQRAQTGSESAISLSLAPFPFFGRRSEQKG